MVKKMKRSIAFVLLVLLLAFVFAACTGAPNEVQSTDEAVDTETAENGGEEPDDSVDETAKEYQLGIVFSGLTNSVWVDLVNHAEVYAKEKYNANVTSVSYDDDPSKFVEQMENFITAGYDGIIYITPTTAGEDVLQKAKDNGIALCAYTTESLVDDIKYAMPDHDAGVMCGTMAAAWINEHETLKNKETIEVGVFGSSVFPDIAATRVQGMKDALAELAPNAEVVIEQDALVATEGFDGAENMLQAYPDMDIILSFGDGGGVGANEAIVAANADDDFGIFTIDGSLEAVTLMAMGGYIRGCANLGGGALHAEAMIDETMKVVRGEDYESVLYMPVLPITYDNLPEMMEQLNYDIEVTVDYEALAYFGDYLE